MAEMVISWQLLRHADIAWPEADQSSFHAGKVASARFFLFDVAPKVTARRAAVEAEDGWLMRMEETAF